MLAGFLAAGVAVTWPLATYITGRLPATRDVAVYVWDLWWVAHQVVHLQNPWSTTYMAAPVGLQLAYHTLVPLLGVVMIPVTLAFGPSAAYNLLLIVLPGLSGYAMYRAARLWLPTRAGAIAAGAFFGLSGMVTYQDWYHINIAYGTLFLPVTLEAAVRLRRKPTIGQGVILGVVLACCLLVNQESAVMALILAALVLVGWLVRSGTLEVAVTRLRAVVAAGTAFIVAGSPQLIAMIQQTRSGGTASAPGWLGYTTWVANVQDLFAPSPRLADDPGLAGLGHVYFWQTTLENLNTFGVVLSLLAVAGLIVSWRRRSAWLLALLWLGGTALALGPVLKVGRHTYVPLAQNWGGLRVSALMPYTWFIRVPGLSTFREADRMALLALVGAALLAGAAVDRLARAGSSRDRTALGLAGDRRRRGARGPGGGLARQPRRRPVHAHHAAGAGPPDRRGPFRLDRGGRAVRPVRRPAVGREPGCPGHTHGDRGRPSPRVHLFVVGAEQDARRHPAPSVLLPAQPGPARLRQDGGADRGGPGGSADPARRLAAGVAAA